MKLTEGNLKVFKHHDGYALKILMPDGSGNYLHNGNHIELDETILDRELLLEMDIDHMCINTKEEDEYFRIELRIPDVNGNKHYFHSRKVNLNDVVFERMQLLGED